jgi:hypothetical protein
MIPAAPETADTLAGLAPTEDYIIDEHLNNMYEIDAARVARLLPSPLSPKEPRPGTAIINIGYMKFDATHIGGLADTIELTFSIIIHPDLALDMPMPRISVFDLQIASNCPVFLAHEDEYQKLNGMHLPGLARELQAPGHLRVWDDAGPILEFRNPNLSPIYKYEYATGQYVSDHPSGLHQGVFSWEGIGCEQQPVGDCGRLYSHRFYQDIDVGWVGDCYLQMFLATPGQALFRSFNTRRLR